MMFLRITHNRVILGGWRHRFHKGRRAFRRPFFFRNRCVGVVYQSPAAARSGEGACEN